MTKTAVALSVILTLAAISTANAQSGTININGELTSTTCDLTWPGGSGSPNNPVITLPTIPANAIPNAGNTAGKVPISVVIGGAGAQCTSGTAAIELNPNRNANQTNGYLNNTLPAGANVATKVQVALRDGKDAPINISTPWRSPPINLATTKQIDFGAEYRASAAAPTAGRVSAAVGYTIDYN